MFPQSFAPPGWDKGMDRESVLAVVNMFNSGVSSTTAAVTGDHLQTDPSPLF